MISVYFTEFEKLINSADFVIASEIKKRKINDFFGIIEAEIFFENGILTILEVVKESDKSLKKEKYKYHFRDRKDILVFRYDNAAHHFEIETFPHHKHLHNKIIPSIEPNLLRVLSEIKEIIEKDR